MPAHDLGLAPFATKVYCSSYILTKFIKEILMRYLFLFTLLLTLSLSQSASAQMRDAILELPDGQVILNISATERKDVEQDLLVSVLEYSSTNREASLVQDEINKAMKEALDILEKSKDKVKFNTGTYNVYERTEPRTQERKWYGSQSITLKSMDADKVLELSGKLQKMKFTTNGLQYMLAPETAVKIQDGLMEDALKQLQTRANRAAKALGKSSAELREVNVEGVNIPYANIRNSGMAMMKSADMEMAAPVAASGEDTITLNVNARVILKP
jgi:predicted secreted protein